MGSKLDLSAPLTWDSPYWDGEAVDISVADFVPTAARGTTGRGLYVGGTGDVVLVLQGGGSVTFKAVPTATLLVALY